LDDRIDTGMQHVTEKGDMRQANVRRNGTIQHPGDAGQANINAEEVTNDKGRTTQGEMRTNLIWRVLEIDSNYRYKVMNNYIQIFSKNIGPRSEIINGSGWQVSQEGDGNSHLDISDGGYSENSNLDSGINDISDDRTVARLHCRLGATKVIFIEITERGGRTLHVRDVTDSHTYSSIPGDNTHNKTGDKYMSKEKVNRNREIEHPAKLTKLENGVQKNLAAAGRYEALRRSSRALSANRFPVTGGIRPQLRYTPIEQTVSPGAPVSLKCSAIGTPTPTLTWTRDSQPLLSSHRVRVGTFHSMMGEVVAHVNLSDVTVREGGLYTCIATNNAGTVAHSSRLNVYGPPFVRSMQNVTVASGDTARLWCPAGGFPTPALTWRRDGQILPQGRRQVVLTNGTLMINKVDKSDVGRYTCLASSHQGHTASADTFLNILRPPVIESFEFKREKEEGQRTQISCTVSEGDFPMTINWLKDGRHLMHDPDIEVKQSSDFLKMILFKNLKEHHAGKYTCEAANAAASVNHTATLKIKLPPRWNVEPTSSTALVGLPLVMDCSARGYPPPLITWTKATGVGNERSQNFLPVVLDGIRSSMANNGSLILAETQPNDAGWYRCRADNSVGKHLQKLVQISVHAPAKVLTEAGRKTAHAGQTVTLNCEASGDLPLTLVWMRHNTVLGPDHRTSVIEKRNGDILITNLEVRDVMAADAGSYTCRASNPHDQNSKVFTLAVIEPPTAPGNVEVTDVSSRAVKVSWTLPQPASVTIQYRVSSEPSWMESGHNISIGAWATSHTLNGLAPYQTYALRLLAHNDLGVSNPSETKIFTTTQESPSGYPRNVQVSSGGSQSLVVTWSPPESSRLHGPLRGYTLSLRPQRPQGQFTFITRPASGTDYSVQERYEVWGLLPGTLYEVGVRAFNRAGQGPTSSPKIVIATEEAGPSCPAVGVMCRASGRGSLRVWWSPPAVSCERSATVTGYTITAIPTDSSTSSYKATWEVNTTNLEKNLASLPPATNISIRIRAYNDAGFSPATQPVYCNTQDEEPGPPENVRAVAVSGGNSVVVSWSPPHTYTGAIIHYNLYSTRGGDFRETRDTVTIADGGGHATWKQITGLTPGTRIQVWVSASTSAGEGAMSPRMSTVPGTTGNDKPVAVGGARAWRVTEGSGLTLPCRGLGSPVPKLLWRNNHGALHSNTNHQVLPGGDLHIASLSSSNNYTCTVSNRGGRDSLIHSVVVLMPPSPPILRLSRATHHALNLSITSQSNGGSPILGYTVHHRSAGGEWKEVGVSPSRGVETVMVLSELPCGSSQHLYVTAWNSVATSGHSQVTLGRTRGSVPGQPDSSKLMEMNSTCLTIRLYNWPEHGCPITHWKIEQAEETSSQSWSTSHSQLPRSTDDLDLCNLGVGRLLRLTAASEAGDTSVVYSLKSVDPNAPLQIVAVQDVLVDGVSGLSSWMDVHVIAGVISAILLATAIIICACVAVTRSKYRPYSQSKDDEKSEATTATPDESRPPHLYSPISIKKPRSSLASIKPTDEASDPYEICPYATFSRPLYLTVGNEEDNVEYGLSLAAVTSPRDCLDAPDQQQQRSKQDDATYGQRLHTRAKSEHYKETEISCISSHEQSAYGTHSKYLSSKQAPNPKNVPNSKFGRGTPSEAHQNMCSQHQRSKSTGRTDVSSQGSSSESYAGSSPPQSRQPQYRQYEQQKQAKQLPQQAGKPNPQQKLLQPQQYQHYQHSQLQRQLQQQLAHRQKLPQQQLGIAPKSGGGGGGGVLSPMPPVRVARNSSRKSSSSSSDSSVLSLPRPLYPPSGFSDSQELSEAELAECDRGRHRDQLKPEKMSSQALITASGRSRDYKDDKTHIKGLSKDNEKLNGKITQELNSIIQIHKQEKNKSHNMLGIMKNKSTDLPKPASHCFIDQSNGPFTINV
ncbi:unnamed protein product, partial [Meganyctiphanes norvegica]